MKTPTSRCLLVLVVFGLLSTPFFAATAQAVGDGPRMLTLDLRTRDTDGRPVIARTEVPAASLAIVVTDVWSYHWCATCAQRFGAAVPRMNRAFAEARKLGLTIFFTPSEAVSAYAGAPQRSGLASFADVPLPPEQPFNPPRPPGELGGCMCGRPFECRVDYGEQAMHPDLVIGPRDFICASRQELYNVCQARGIHHLIHAGFAANMCLWGKECGLISTARLGFTCLVARDLTDAFGGTTTGSEGLDRFTARVVEHIEQRVVPTIDLLEEMRKAAGAREPWVVDPVRIGPWGTTNRPVFFAKAVRVSFSPPGIAGAELRYTTNGRAPAADSPLYREPLVFEETTLVRVAGFKDGQRVALDSDGYYCRLPEEPPLPGVHISDLEWQQASLPGYAYWPGFLPWHAEGAPPPQKDRSYADAPLRLRGVVYPKGIGVHAPARLLYELKPQYEWFVAKAGVDETMLKQQGGRGRAGFPSVVFKVFLDGVLATESPVMRMQQEPWRFRVPIPQGSRLIELVVTDAGDGPREDLANWVNAGFVLQPEEK